VTDDRIWRPDLLAVLDWEAVGRATEKVYGKRQLATWWAQATPGVNYYRAEMPAKHLPGRTVRLETRDVQFEGGEHYFPRQRGAAIWMFPGNITRWLLMAEMKDNGRRVLVEVDDNYTTGPPVSLSGWTVKQRDNPDASYEAHVKIVGSKACDGVIVATPQLGRVYERFGKPTYVCRNSVDAEDWPEDPDHQPDGVLRIGWAGSASHQYDLADIRPALDWASRQKDVEIVVLGQLDPGVQVFARKGYRSRPLRLPSKAMTKSARPPKERERSPAGCRNYPKLISRDECLNTLHVADSITRRSLRWLNNSGERPPRTDMKVRGRCGCTIVTSRYRHCTCRGNSHRLSDPSCHVPAPREGAPGRSRPDCRTDPGAG